MLRILIADDHTGVRHALRNILLEEFQPVFIEESVETVELIQKATNNDWDIIISDLAMPGGGGLNALKAIKSVKPYVPVIIFSTYPPEQYESRVINAGAAAFISKESPVTRLIAVIRSLISRDL